MSNTVERLVISDTIATAIDVLFDDYGTGRARVKALKEAGYDPHVVQACVNDLVALMQKYPN